MKINLKDNHYFLTSSSDFHEICKPLLNYSCVNYVAYHYFDLKNGTFYGLHTFGLIAKYCLENALYLTAKESKMLQNIPYRFVSPELELPFGVNEKRYQGNIELCNSFNAINRFYILNINEDYAEYYGFGTSLPVGSATQFFINNMDILKIFISYIQSKAQRLIQEAKKNAVVLPNFLDKNENQLKELTSRSDLERKQLLEIVNRGVEDFLVAKFTPREIQVLTKVAEGWTYKEIANRFEISQRTVEVHVQNIKLKTQCFSKTQLRELGRKELPIYSIKTGNEKNGV